MEERVTRTKSGTTKPFAKLQQSIFERKLTENGRTKKKIQDNQDASKYLDEVLVSVAKPTIHVVPPNNKLFAGNPSLSEPPPLLTVEDEAPATPAPSNGRSATPVTPAPSPVSPSQDTPITPPPATPSSRAAPTPPPNTSAVPKSQLSLLLGSLYPPLAPNVAPSDFPILPSTATGPVSYAGSSITLDPSMANSEVSSFEDLMFVESITPKLKQMIRDYIWHQLKVIGVPELDHIACWVTNQPAPPAAPGRRKAIHSRIRLIFRVVTFVRTRAFVNGWVKRASVMLLVDPNALANFRANKLQAICEVVKQIKQPTPTKSDVEFYAGEPWAKAEMMLAKSLAQKRLAESSASEAENFATDDESTLLDKLRKRKAIDMSCSLPKKSRISQLRQSDGLPEDSDDEGAEDEDDEEDGN